MMNYYNAFIQRYNFLENYYLYFPNDEIIMKAIAALPVELIRVKDDIHITIRYNEKTIYNKDTNVKYAPYGASYKIALHQALYDDIDELFTSVLVPISSLSST